MINLSMIFPFSVIFDKKLKSIVTSDNEQKILQFIMTSILEDKADNVVVEDACVKYKGSTSNWRGSLFRTVDCGVFNLICKGNKWRLNYQINMRRLFIYTAIMSTMMEVFLLSSGGPWWFGVVLFLWLCGGNWIISFIRHEAVAVSIAAGIDDLICGKTEPLQQDKMTGKVSHL